MPLLSSLSDSVSDGSAGFDAGETVTVTRDESSRVVTVTDTVTEAARRRRGPQLEGPFKFPTTRHPLSVHWRARPLLRDCRARRGDLRLRPVAAGHSESGADQ